ncbi:DUF4870 domain-containing protein [Anaerotruncus colihominis]|uniref:DUF4870 domain-containing protein n=1 Tax=Anaerotruncus colihominis TaxID=169435 RepID=UPI0026F0E827|nr:DUF4870 domain-containing protein [Anaerotruncus colihominis]
MNTYQPHRSSLGGLDANIMALLCYLVTFVGGLIPVVKYVAWLLPLVIVFLEKESGLVKFHAMQAFVLNLISFVVTVIIAILTVVGTGAAVAAGSAAATFGVLGVLGIVSLAISIAILVFSIIAMVKSYGYRVYNIPLIGGIAQALVSKFPPANIQG